MSLEATVKIGDAISVSVNGSNMVDLIKGAAKVAGFPQKCGHCKSGNLSFMHRQAGQQKEYDYFHLKCNDCGAQCDIGQNKGSNVGDVFFRFDPNKGANGERRNPELINVKDSFYKYFEQPKRGEQGVPGGEHPVEVDPDPEDEIPF